MSAYDRALLRARREAGTQAEATIGAASWLPPADGEDGRAPVGLLDHFTREDTPGQDHARLVPVREDDAVAAEPATEVPLPEDVASAGFVNEAEVVERPATLDHGAGPDHRPPPPSPEAPPGPSPGAGPARAETDARWQAERRDATRLFNGFNPRFAGMLVSAPRMDQGTAEQYGRLAAVLHHAQVERGVKTVMVTSALAGEGKTLTALNLALTLSDAYGRRVAFIDADLRRSRVHELLNVARVTGLSEALQDDRELGTRLLEVSPTLSILLAGCSSLDPKGALTSKRMAGILAEAAASFDWVIVDTPPVVLLPDTDLLARMVDAAVVVVRAGQTPYDAVDVAVRTIDRKRVLGVVLNDAQDAEALQYYSARATR